MSALDTVLIDRLLGPWVGNCVGLRNYRNFYMFIVLLTILDLFVGACAIAHLVMRKSLRASPKISSPIFSES